MIWIWLLAVLLVLGAWVGGFFLAFPLWLKILLTVVAVLAVATAFVVRRIRASMRARALERELLKQAEQQALNARPDRRAEILELKLQIEKGLATLKSSKLGAGGGNALYTLPWYMIIGPPGAGKTTALKHSGLVFPFLDPHGKGGVRGIGGTRNCDWWFANEAILLDTAGRYATEADDHEEWIAFLDMLKKYRPRAPVNGVLVAISATDLLEANDEQLDAFAKRLRARIDEVTTRLQMVVPVYVTLTKVDLVAGFVEFFGDLRKSERGQIWGMTFPLQGADRRDVPRAFEEEFDVLLERLHARALQRAGAERQVELRQRIYQFPLEFASIKQNLSEFLGDLLQANNFQETPILRGVYFTSGTQEGRPIDRVIGGMMRAFSLPEPEAVRQPQTESKSYFVTDLFRRVVFPDQNVAARTRSEQRRRFANRLAFALAAFLIAGLIVLPAIYTFGQNLSFVRESEAAAAQTQKVNWKDGNPDIAGKAHAFDALSDRLDELDKWRAEGPPWRLRWGMYEGDALYPALRSVYVSELQAGFARPAQAELENELAGVTVGGGHLSLDQYNRYFTRLKAYLEATDPTHTEPDWASGPLTDAWAAWLGTTSAADKAALRPHVNHYLRLLQRQEIPPWKADTDLVNRVRSLLKRTSEADRNYGALVRDANENIAPITRSNIFIGSTFATFITSKSTPEVVVMGAFTRMGWESYIRDRLDPDRAKKLAQDRWVLGETEQRGIEEMQRQLNELRDRYFAEFRNAWKDFLADLDVRQPGSNAETLDELQALSETPWPYAKLLKVLDDNTHLELAESTADEAESAILQAAQKTGLAKDQRVQQLLGDAGVAAPPKWVSPVEEAFRPMTTFGVPAAGDKPAPTALSHYIEQIIAKVVGVLSDAKDSKAPPDAKTVQDTFSAAFRGTSELLASSQSGFTQPLLAPLLLNPLRRGFAGVLGDVAGAAGGQWELDVWQKWHDKLEGKYPFEDSAQEATLADYSEFFKPGKGLLWTFYDKRLSASLERSGDTFVPVTRFQHAIRFTPEFLQCYARGAVFTDQTFAPNAEQPSIAFDVDLHSVSENVSEVTLEIDGVSKTYRNTPEEWLHAEWPAKEPKARGANIRVRGYDSLDEAITRSGDFGIFRILDAASSIEAGTEGGRPDGQPTIVATWKLRTENAWVRIDIRPQRADNAFSSYLEPKHERMFRNYKCPRVVSAGID
ncbi:MAG TPA: type VI secretion system membrane subunit TssM [Polyangiaceae bacterium]